MQNISLEGKKQPEKKFKVGGIEVAIWKNENPEGKRYHSISFNKNYKKDDKWYSTTTINVNDIPKLKLALDEAYKFLNMSVPAKEIIEEAQISNGEVIEEEHLE